MTGPIESNPALRPPGPVGPVTPAGRTGGVGAQPTGPSFASVLGQAAATRGSAPVTFSGHALQRLERRGIVVDQPTMQRLQEGVDRAASKGSRSAVVLVDQNAFVVGVPARTVITAVGRDHMREHVFTNIDSAVIA